MPMIFLVIVLIIVLACDMLFRSCNRHINIRATVKGDAECDQ